MRINELFPQEKVEEKLPLELEKPPENEGGKEFFIQETLKILERNKNTPWGKQQRKSIVLYKEGCIKLTKSIQFGFLIYRKGKEGFLVSKDCFGILDDKCKNFLENGLEKDDCRLIGIDEYLWVLPISHFRILDKKLEQKEMFYED